MILKAENVSKRYFRKTGEANHFFAVKPLNLTLRPGALTVLIGRSGSGKTTLLHMLSGLLTPTEGKVWLDDIDLYALEDSALCRLRGERIAVVPQGRSALDALTVMENILLPRAMYGNADSFRPEAEAWLEKFGIAELKNAKPAQLSGGELRRMAVARALTGQPGVILADEPTGDLDDENTRLVLQAFRSAADAGRAVFLVTHETDALQYADCVYKMDGGVIAEKI